MSRRLMTLFAVLGLAMAMMSPTTAGGETPTVDLGGDNSVVESEYGSYIVVMKADPLIVEFGQDGLQSNAAEKKAKGLAKGHEKALDDAGVDAEVVHSYTNALNGFSAFMSYEEALAIADLKEVAMVLPDDLRQLTTDSSPGFLGLTDPAGPWQTGYDGEGVVIGVIDSGIWPEHPSFADDGSYPEPPITLSDDRPNCEFGNTAHNSNDAPFECNNKLIGARQMLDTYRLFIGAAADEFDSARDDDGHGTHTASTAGGNAGVEASILGVPRGTVSGIAPRAHIVAYKGLGNLGGFGSDLAAAIDQAVADGVDVINYSVGGGPSLTGADDIAYLFAADAGVFVATSASNNGPGPDTIGGPASVPWLTSVGASTQSRAFEGSASSSDGWEFFGASITAGTDELPLVDAADAGDELCNPGALDASVVAGKIVLCKRGAIARVAKGYAVYLAGGAGMILYNENDGQSQVTDTHWVPSVHINNTDGLVIKDYIANTADPVAQINGGEKTTVDAPSMASFSSRGPNGVAEDIIKPDITAPGVQILAGASPFPDPGSVPGELFQAIAGTSMSSPHIAGVFALIKQARPDWTPAMAKSAIMTTAYQDVVKEDGVTLADPFDMGAGHVDPGNVVHKGSAFQPGLVYDAGFLDYLGFLCDAEPSALAPTTCPFLESIGVPTDASDLNLPSIGIGELAGSQTVTRTVTSVAQENGWRTYDVSVDAPDGYDVTVSPSRIRLKRGQSATYQVTFTSNGTVPVGVWSHGSLTWSDTTGNYEVYSPISVKGAAFDSPDSVSGTGTSGSASFGVNFGYTGAYTAAPHGLVARTDSSGTVLQDPDQTFSPTDGYSVPVTFSVTGSAFLRFAMTHPNSAVDIDLFLFGPGGNQIASSTNGGTDESIELLLPADGTYTMWVHGWQTAGPSTSFTLESWDVPLASGGSLVLDSAPTSATVGTVGTIDVSWSGLAGGTEYLGAVSHSDGSGLLGLTLVSVDTN